MRSGSPRAFWNGMAARMVDAQAPGIARLLRQMPGILTLIEGWANRALEQLGLLHFR